ncbi:MAG: 4Fe-4S dicluster domain-containing protein [Eggerthellaceae bacterium]|jgi:sulfhydrogenase subunit beta (sulfur reductase)
MLLMKNRLNDLLARLSQTEMVYVPKIVDDVAKFAPYISEGPARFDLVNTTLPPKDLLFPQTQKMYRYGRNDEGDMYIQPLDDSSPRMLFGIRPCDMRSIACLDDVFLTMGYVDEFYQAQRDKLTTVAITCTQPGETCFCDSMEADPNEAPNADVLLRDTEDAYVVVPQTDKGTAEVEAWKDFLEDGERDVEPVSCQLQVPMRDGQVKVKLDQMFDDPIWDDVSRKCLNCGTCTFVCPTCYCFDICQENKMQEGVRFRCWDSCMFSEYTEMAGGHNPRPTKRERVRNRFMHKLNYFEDRYGKELCVGCGRCVQKCPVALDITVLIDRIAAEPMPVAVEPEGVPTPAPTGPGATDPTTKKEASHV